MGKKLIGIAVAAIMLLGVFGLAGCDNISLADYKAKGKAAIDAHVATKTQEDYRNDNWTALCLAVTEGKAEIHKANTKTQVDKAVKEAITKIDKILPEEDVILKEFDLTDPKSTWSGSIDDEFTNNLVIVILRKTSTYPELDLSYFRLDNVISLEYSGGVRPPDYFFEEGNEELLKNYRQIVFIHLQPQGKEKIIETIRALEKLVFVKSAEPNILGYPG